jgi:hypothetical protein
MPSPVTADRMFQRVIIWRAKKAYPELSVPQLADRLRIPTNTVRRSLKLLEVSPKDVLQAFEHEAVSAWQAAIPIASSKGDHRPAKDLLLHSRAIDPVQLQGQTQIAIIFTTGTVPGLQSPSGSDASIALPSVIDVSNADVRTVSSVQQTSEPEVGQGPQSGSG